MPDMSSEIQNNIAICEGETTGQSIDDSSHVTNVESLIEGGKYEDSYIYIINNMDSMKNGKLQNEIWIKIGNYKFNNDEYEQALKMYNNMNTYDRYTDTIFLNIAYCYQQLNKSQESLTYYYKHLSFNINDEYCINNIAVLEYYCTKNYENALKMYTKMNTKHIIQNKLYFNIAFCYFYNKQYDNALNYFDKHLSTETNKNRSDCLISMAWIYTNKFKNYTKALEMYNQLDINIINHKNLEFDIGYNYEQTQQYNEALKYYILYIKKNPNNIDTLHNIAWIYIEIMNNFERAKPYMIKILILNKKHFYANYAYGKYLCDTVKNYNLSLQCFKIAYNVQP
eukprot:312769_1